VNGVTESAQDRSVSTLELFTDLVFVFAVTQLTALLAEDPTPRGVLEVLLIFGVAWWMFGGYVFLTNAMAPDRKVRRLLLLAGMMGFLVIGLAIPSAFHGGGVVLGLGYLVVVVVHAGLFIYGSGTPFVDVLRFAPMNLAGAVLILIGGVVQGTAAYVLWGLALGGQVVSSLVSVRGAFRLRVGHFVERYGLLVLIVLGESIVAIGVGAAGLPLDASLVGAAILALAITSGLWWIYFSGDDARAAEALASAPVERHIRIALGAFFYATIPMLLGVVALAAGVKTAIANAFDPLPPEGAAFLAAGVALYLLGDALFRRAIGAEKAVDRLLAGLVALLALPVGVGVSAIAELGMLLAVLVAVIILAARTERMSHPAVEAA
jgi:low temperature requirement protein LtrA